MKISDVLKQALLHTCRFCGGKKKEVGVIYWNFRVHWICTECTAKRKAVAEKEAVNKDAQIMKESSPWLEGVV